MNALISIVDEANNDKQEFLIKDIVDKNNLYFSSEEYCLLVNIFNPRTPLHDGAVIIGDNKIKSAACLLPLSNDKRIKR